jgi:hypothetical protein
MMAKEKFSLAEVTALRNELMQRMLDTSETAELLQVFLMGRGYGVSPQAALDAASRMGAAGCSMDVISKELEGVALVM